MVCRRLLHAINHGEKTMITIISKKEGFRRCGVPHPSQPTNYPQDRFTKKEIEILKAEPMLTVVEKDDPEPIQANKAVALVKAATTTEELDTLAQGETRKSVVDAIAARRKELDGNGA